jgi:hypothetical protein
MKKAKQKKNKINKEHYVHQRYLDSFVRDGHIYAFDKTTGKSYPSNVRDVASQRGFYDLPELDEIAGEEQAFEKFFQPFETAVGPVLKAIREELYSNTFKAITKDQRIDLSIFLAVQMLRTPESRELYTQLSLTLHKHAFLRWLKDRQPELPVDENSFDLEMTDKRRILTHAQAVLDPEQRERIAEIIFQHF